MKCACTASDIFGAFSFPLAIFLHLGCRVWSTGWPSWSCGSCPRAGLMLLYPVPQPCSSQGLLHYSRVRTGAEAVI